MLLGRGLCCSGLFSLEGSKDPGIPWPQAEPEDVWMLDNPQRPQVVGCALLVQAGHKGSVGTLGPAHAFASRDTAQLLSRAVQKVSQLWGKLGREVRI